MRSVTVELVLLNREILRTQLRGFEKSVHVQLQLQQMLTPHLSSVQYSGEGGGISSKSKYNKSDLPEFLL